MRYVLTVFGLVALFIGLGAWIINWNATEANLSPVKFFVLAGVIATSIGFATINIVNAISESKSTQA